MALQLEVPLQRSEADRLSLRTTARTAGGGPSLESGLFGPPTAAAAARCPGAIPGRKATVWPGDRWIEPASRRRPRGRGARPPRTAVQGQTAEWKRDRIGERGFGAHTEVRGPPFHRSQRGGGGDGWKKPRSAYHRRTRPSTLNWKSPRPSGGRCSQSGGSPFWWSVVHNLPHLRRIGSTLIVRWTCDMEWSGKGGEEDGEGAVNHDGHTAHTFCPTQRLSAPASINVVFHGFRPIFNGVSAARLPAPPVSDPALRIQPSCPP
jgi:hypothetical protein